MKKSVLAMAVLGAMSVSAMAANVTVYGVVDTGLNYSHVEATGVAATSDFQMKSGQQAGSRWGLKGSEVLAEGYKAGFTLEGGIDSDTGAMGQNGRLFGREANIYVVTPYGEFAMGRVGGVGGGSGSYALVGKTNAFGTTWGSYATNASQYMICADRHDNMITYRSPKMSGLQLTMQYSLNAGSKDGDKTYSAGMTEGSPSANRYLGFGATYANGPLFAVMTVDSMNYGNVVAHYEDNSLAVTLGGSYDFGVMKAYLGAQVFESAARATLNGKFGQVKGAQTGSLTLMDGYGLTVSADVPAFGGTAKVAFGYTDAEESNDSAKTLERVGMTMGYQYKLSKSTNVYAAASWMKNTYEDTSKEVELEAVEVLAGIRHNF